VFTGRGRPASSSKEFPVHKPSTSFRIAALAGLAIGCGHALAQPVPDPSIEVPLFRDSGPFGLAGAPAPGFEPVLAWQQEIVIPAMHWLRIHFSQDTVLSGPDRDRGGAYIVIRSHADGEEHFLDASSLDEWDRISAYMNGDRVTLELYVPPAGGQSRVVVDKVTAGLGWAMPESICGNTDDRLPYNDPRVARLSTGCTAWLISTGATANQFLTAGHCINNNQTGVVVSFNVPPSTSSGGTVAPPPAFQFPVQAASIQSVDTGAGNDYARFYTSNNSNTRMPSRVAQGRGAFILAGSAPASGTAATTVRGHGVVNNQSGIPNVSWLWNRINKRHTGPYAGKTGTRIFYSTDTTPANSGSPVTQIIGTLIPLEQAIGIHTHGGCPSNNNSGTAIEHSGLQNFLNNPQGNGFPYDTNVYKVINTTLASNNGGSDGGTIFFDVTTGVRSIEVTHFNLNIHFNGNSNNATTTEADDFFNFEVFVRPGTAAGAQSNQALWTKVADGAGMPRLQDEYSHGALRNTFTLPGSQSFGMAIVFDSGAGHRYTNGTGSNETYSNADLSITGISASNTAFGTNIANRVFNGGIGYRLNQSGGQCLETLFAANNGLGSGSMVFFNVVTGSTPVTLSGLRSNLEGAGGTACTLTLYRKLGTHVGFETNAGAWTQVATAAGTSAPENEPSVFAFNQFVTLNPNTTYGFAARVVGTGHRYTNGNGLNQSYSDGTITINAGSAVSSLFSGTVFTPRIWNGSLCYGRSLATCPGSLFGQQPPNASLGGFNSTPGAQEEADNFTLPQNSSITSGTFWAAYSDSTTPPVTENLVLRFFTNVGGLPGTLVATRTLSNVAVKDTGLIMAPWNKPIYQYDVNFAAVNLNAGTYWVSALGNTPGYTWAWARTNTLANAHAVRQGTGPWGLSAGDFAFSLCGTTSTPPCYANCDGSTTPPILNVADFTCFLTKFAAGDPYANCDGSTTPPVLNVADFTCFLTKFAAGC
jgi:hypothetical protein